MLIKNAADPQQLKRAGRIETQRAERDRADLQNVVSSEQGRRFVWKLLCESAVFQQSFVQGAADLTAFNEGRRRIGLGLMLDLAAIDPTLYHRMAKEAHDLEEAEAQGSNKEKEPESSTKETDDATD